jgi:hypothetical protein
MAEPTSIAEMIAWNLFNFDHEKARRDPIKPHPSRCVLMWAYAHRGGDAIKYTGQPEEGQMPRTNISIDEDVFEELSSEAKRTNKTLFAFANEALGVVSRISAEGGDPAGIYGLWRAITVLKQVDVITLPSEFVDELVAKEYAADKRDILKMFSDLGTNLVGILKIAASDIEQLAQLSQDFALLLPIKRIKITKGKDPDSIEISIVGAGRRIESTECSFAFLQAILNGYGYTVTKHEINTGTIIASASKRGFG